MISALDLAGALAATVALIRFSLNGHASFSAGERWIVLILCSTTALINTLSFVAWLGHDHLSEISEDWSDYLQILQPAFWGMLFYVVLQSRHRRDLAASQKRLRDIVENMPVLLTAHDSDGKILAWNREAHSVTGYSIDEIAETDHLQILFPQAQQREDFLAECSNGGGDYQHSIRTIVGRNGSKHVAWFNISRKYPVSGWANWSIGLDITESVQARQRLEFMASHDELTGLANRGLLQHRLRSAIAAIDNTESIERMESIDSEEAIAITGNAEVSRRSNKKGALIMLDLDNYKMVNDTYGHLIGDRLLYDVGQRIQNSVGNDATVARIGGDEFMILIAGLSRKEEATIIADWLLKNLRATPFHIDGARIYTEASLGITVYPDDGNDPAELLKNVDMALYAAKENGRNGFCFYSRDLHDRFRWQHMVAENLRSALLNDHLQLYYQPQIDVADGRLIGAEALLRWPGFEGGLSPAVFVPIAESRGLMLPLGQWVLNKAFSQAARWNQQSGFTTGINLSAIQFYQSDLVDTLKKLVTLNRISPENIDLEITESAVMRDADLAIASMKRLRDSGFHISLDDFGTGFSSLSYLKRFPVSRLKIDQSFVHGMESSADDTAIVHGVIRLGHDLGLSVVAEGVENAEQLSLLKEGGCDIVQGFFFSPPVPVENMEAMLAKGDARN